MPHAAIPRRHSQSLIILGLILFLVGLLNGAVVSYFANPRMGLSAHLAGVQNGLVLCVFGLFWDRLRLSGTLSRLSYWLSLIGMYGIWLGLLLAAVWGTSSSTPIAGAGYAGTPVEEMLVTAIIAVSSISIIIAVVLIICGAIRARRKQHRTPHRGGRLKLRCPVLWVLQWWPALSPFFGRVNSPECS